MTIGDGRPQKAKVFEMVSTSVAQHMDVAILATRESSIVTIGELRDVVPTDAFDYAIQAQGYFRFAIQEMDASLIEIEVSMNGTVIQLIAITRD